ncbi:antitrypsin-like [Arctopsyche grandis]|uniref:antitrypsin-like n=1 Tax=Arctopsyche grandis TaxID=121162 RepID=UPI00406D910D
MGNIYILFSTLFLLPILATSFNVDEHPNIINPFSLKFYKEATLQNADKNLIMSPLSAEVLLGLLSVGARGNTQKEINNAIQLQDPEMIKSTFQATMAKLNSIEGIKLNIANKIYVKDGENFQLSPAFKSVAADHFSSDVQNVDFSHSEQVTRAINEWVESKTNHKIKDFIPPKTIDKTTELVLVNAIYFQGSWQKPFNKKLTHKKKFNKNEKDTVDVDLMCQKGYFSHAELPEWNSDILSLPYTNSDTSLIIILPKTVNGLKALEEKILNCEIHQILNMMESKQVDVSIPKFKIESTFNLKTLLPELGMKTLFSANADFHHLLKSHARVYVSKATQKAFIEVNELGTEAGAATDFQMTRGSSNVKTKKVDFIADHPFYYMLMHNEDIIFCGKYIGA